MPFADLSGVMVHRMRLTVPFSGRWHADLALVTNTDVSGPQILNIVGIPWSCAYVRAIDFSGERGIRVVAGTGGWAQTIASKQYGPGPPQVTTQMVVNDAALACGEPSPVLDPSVPATIGNAFLRQSGAAAAVLNAILGSAWWIGSSGVVQTAPRGGTVASPFYAERVDGATGVYVIATESPQDWTPGISFAGPTVSGIVSRVTHVIDRDKLRTEVMVA